MRHFIVGVVAVSVTLLVAAQAGAVTIRLRQNTAGIGTNSQVELRVFLENTGQPGITFTSFSIGYDESLLTFTSESLKNKRLQKSHNENAYPTTGALQGGWLTPFATQHFTNEVVLTWGNTNGVWHENSNLIMAVVTFTSGTTPGFIPLTVKTGTGSTLGFLGGTYASPGTGLPDQIASVVYRGIGGVYVPEPAAASLSLAAVVTLYLLRSRQRRR